MKLKYIALTSILILVACAAPTQTQQPAAEASSVPPAQAAASQPLTQVSSTEPSSDPNYFRDDFETTLAPGWEWRNEDPSDWSLESVPGSLQINVDGGQVSDDTITNLLLRAAPTGDFQIETKVTFRPQADYQVAGLIIYESPPNLIQAGRAYCDLPDVCLGEGLYVDYYQDGNFVTPNFAAAYTEPEVYLRLVRRGDTYTFQSSADGSVWILRGGTVSEMNPLQVGLVAGQNSAGLVPALFDYFEVRSIP